eukprot:Hpha_TRINITY_DN13341_c0_g2::TRINITY_DN13341_c0_g2_i2::g.95641::m.95641
MGGDRVLLRKEGDWEEVWLRSKSRVFFRNRAEGLSTWKRDETPFETQTTAPHAWAGLVAAGGAVALCCVAAPPPPSGNRARAPSTASATPPLPSGNRARAPSTASATPSLPSGNRARASSTASGKKVILVRQKDGWTEWWHNERGRPFYENNQTGEKVWRVNDTPFAIVVPVAVTPLAVIAAAVSLSCLRPPSSPQTPPKELPTAVPVPSSPAPPATAAVTTATTP